MRKQLSYILCFCYYKLPQLVKKTAKKRKLSKNIFLHKVSMAGFYKIFIGTACIYLLKPNCEFPRFNEMHEL